MSKHPYQELLDRFIAVVGEKASLQYELKKQNMLWLEPVNMIELSKN
jgi:hypothetical protein